MRLNVNVKARKKTMNKRKRPSNNKKLGGFFFVYKIRSKREFPYKIVLQVAPTDL